MNTSNELRAAFLDYFRSRGHEVVASSSLVPGNDPTLLFTNSGMVQFKDVFLGADPRSYTRAVTSQRCVRAGGKHNDLENVGYTARHHTFFEMLGNFSFGDYFKREAIAFAWEFLTREMGLARDRMWITVFEDDDEAEDIWRRDVGIESSRIVRCGEKDNFWSMGDIGPCGPCSEVFYDHGPEVAGGPPGSPDEGRGPLRRDLEPRLHAVQPGRRREHEPAAQAFGRYRHGARTRRRGVAGGARQLRDRSLPESHPARRGPDRSRGPRRQVAAGSSRITSARAPFSSSTACFPRTRGAVTCFAASSRRAIRHGHRLGMREPFFHRLAADLEAEMGQAYPELTERRGGGRSNPASGGGPVRGDLGPGPSHIGGRAGRASGRRRSRRGRVPPLRHVRISGGPRGRRCARARPHRGTTRGSGARWAPSGSARGPAAASGRCANGGARGSRGASEFIGYDRLRGKARVIGLYADGHPVDALAPEDHGAVVLGRTPFYPEGGGQVGDRGVLRGPGAVLRGVRYPLERECNRPLRGVATEGEVRLGDEIDASVDAAARAATRRATTPRPTCFTLPCARCSAAMSSSGGSLVAPDRLRFDFSHFEPIGPVARLENRAPRQPLGPRQRRGPHRDHAPR